MFENGEAFCLDLWICFKTVGVVHLLANCNGLKLSEMVTLKV